MGLSVVFCTKNKMPNSFEAQEIEDIGSLERSVWQIVKKLKSAFFDYVSQLAQISSIAQHFYKIS